MFLDGHLPKEDPKPREPQTPKLPRQKLRHFLQVQANYLIFHLLAAPSLLILLPLHVLQIVKLKYVLLQLFLVPAENVHVLMGISSMMEDAFAAKNLEFLTIALVNVNTTVVKMPNTSNRENSVSVRWVSELGKTEIVSFAKEDLSSVKVTVSLVLITRYMTQKRRCVSVLRDISLTKTVIALTGVDNLKFLMKEVNLVSVKRVLAEVNVESAKSADLDL
mgnify:CR=1 FL=1